MHLRIKWHHLSICFVQSISRSVLLGGVVVDFLSILLIPEGLEHLDPHVLDGHNDGQKEGPDDVERAKHARQLSKLLSDCRGTHEQQDQENEHSRDLQAHQDELPDVVDVADGGVLPVKA